MGTWFCQSCGAGNGYTLIERYTGKTKVEILKFLDDGNCGVTSEEPVKRFAFTDADFSPDQVKKNRQRLIEVSSGCKPLTGSDPVSLYLCNRVPGCDLSKISSDVLFHPGLKFFEEGEGGRFVNRGTFPAMVARAVDATGKPITLHRTYLTTTGAKAPFENAKKQMKGIRKLDGAAIRLVEVPESRTLGLTEGIETGLAVATGYRNRINVWSMLNCVNLSLADIPAGRFDKIIIFADHDCLDVKNGYRPGQHYAEQLQARLEKSGYDVEVKLPVKEGSDFADVWFAVCQEKQEAASKIIQTQAPVGSVLQPQLALRPTVRPHAQHHHV